jgi:hypothetical protein
VQQHHVLLLSLQLATLSHFSWENIRKSSGIIDAALPFIKCRTFRREFRLKSRCSIPLWTGAMIILCCLATAKDGVCPGVAPVNKRPIDTSGHR